MKRKMRYLNERNGTYRYVRDYPTKLRRKFPSLPKQFSRELRLDTSCADSDLYSAMERSNNAYELNLKTIMNSDPHSFTDADQRLAVDELYRQKNLQPGQLADYIGGEYTPKEWDAAIKSRVVEPSKHDIAYELIPGMDEVEDNERYGIKNNFQQGVRQKAWKELFTKQKNNHNKTMREVWADYIRLKKIDVSTGDGKDKQQRFERVLSYTGDFYVTNETQDEALDRIQEFIHRKQQDNPTIKAQSLRRELKEFVAAIRLVPRLSWRNELSLAQDGNTWMFPTETQPVQGRVLSNGELKLFFDTCIKKPDEKWTALLVAAHAGLGMREIRRLRVDEDIFLNEKYPHILFRGGDEGITKTKARARVVPIVVGLEVIKEWLPRTIAWMNSLRAS